MRLNIKMTRMHSKQLGNHCVKVLKCWQNRIKCDSKIISSLNFIEHADK